MSKQATLERRRAARLETERAASARELRRRRLWRLGAAAAAAVVLVAGAIAVSSSGGAKPAAPATTSSLLAGLPERGGVLGDPEAPLTVTEYVDLQCPICAEASTTILPGLIDDYVKTGKVKLEMRTMHFLGPDSIKSARVAAGAQQQNKLWSFVETFYANQGTENSGYATDDFLRSVAQSAGVDADRALAYAQTDAAADQLNQANSEAQTRGIDSTPTFVVTGEDGKARVVVGHDDASLTAAIKAAR